jgi:MFS family permease
MIALICFRAFQGIGGGALFSLTLVIIGDIVTIRERGRWMGMMGLTFAVSSVLGPVIGGVITDNISWRWIFYINCPIGAVSLVVTWFTLKLPKTSHKSPKEILKTIDYAGIFTVVVGIVLVLLGASLGGSQFDWNSAAIICFFIFGGLLLIAFLVIETKFPEPIIQLRIFLIRNVALANAVAFTVGFSMFGAISYLPIYFQVIHGDSPTVSGLKLLPMMVGIIIFSMGSGIIITKTGRYWVFPIMGCGFMSLGAGLIGGFLTADINIVLLSFFILLIGVGVGSIIQTVTSIVQAFVEKKDMAIATATNSFLRTMGGVIGVTVYGSILNNQLANNLPPELLQVAHLGYQAIQSLPPASADFVITKYVDALCIIFYCTVPVAGIGLILSLFISNKKLQHAGPPPPVEA